MVKIKPGEAGEGATLERIRETKEEIDITELSRDRLEKFSEKDPQELTEEEREGLIVTSFILKSDKLGKATLTEEELIEGVQQFKIECGLELNVRDGYIERIGEWDGFKGCEYRITEKGKKKAKEVLSKLR